MKKAVGLFHKFHKRRDFSISYDSQVLLGVILQCGFPSCILQFGQKENIPGHSAVNTELSDLFWKLSVCFLFSRVGLEWWTLL